MFGHLVPTFSIGGLVNDGPQIGRLLHKGAAIHLRQRRKKVRVVTAEGVKDFLILTQTQIDPDYFNGDHLAIGQFGTWAAFTQAFSFCHYWHHLVNQTETCDNEVVQVHDLPPQKIAKSSEDSRLHEPFLWQALLAHRVS
jgi:hypothetical protein